MLGLEQLSPEDRKVVVRARLLERFLTQPFFTTEQFTNLKGKLVSLADALDGCERILRDEFKDHPESGLYMIGPISEAKGKPKPVPSTASAKTDPKSESNANPKQADAAKPAGKDNVKTDDQVKSKPKSGLDAQPAPEPKPPAEAAAKTAPETKPGVNLQPKVKNASDAHES